MFLLFMSAYKAAYASGFARDLAFSTMKDGICLVTLGPGFIGVKHLS
jgi:thiamine pyrophosphate-dependent acetolactate synthase large subunit-like protein